MPAHSTLFPSGWPAVGTRAFFQQARSLIDYRLAECPASRGTVYYVRPDTVSAAGAVGSQADPFVVIDLAELQAVIDMYGSGNTILVRDDADLRGDTGLSLPNNTTLGVWGSGHWVCSGLSDDSLAGWTDTGFGAYRKADTTEVHWVRLLQHPSIALEAGTETVFRKCGGRITAISAHATAPVFTTETSHGLVAGETVIHYGTNSNLSTDGAYVVATTPTATTYTVTGSPSTLAGAGTAGTWMQRTNNGWAYNATDDILMVRVGANVNPATPGSQIQVCHATGSGINASGTNVRVFGVTSIGWGMESNASGFTPLKATITGTKAAVFDDCYAFYCTNHAVVQAASGVGETGGIITCRNVITGLGRLDSSGQYAAFTSYSDSGANEMILNECEAMYGGLPDTTTGYWSATNTRKGTPYYQHAAGANQIGLGLVWGFRTRDHTYGCVNIGSIGNTVPYTTNRGATGEYRAWIIGDRFDGGDGTFPGFADLYVVRAWCSYNFKPPAGTTGGFFSPTQRTQSAWIGVRAVVDWSNVAGVNANHNWFVDSSAGEMYFDLVHCGFYNQNAPSNYIGFAPAVATPYHAALVRVFNTVWATASPSGKEAGVNLAPNGAPTGASSAADTALTGGGRSNAYYKTTSNGTGSVYGPANFSADYLGHDGQTGSIDLTTEPSSTVAPIAGDQLYGVANIANLPFAVEWWMNPLVSYAGLRMPTAPSIGPVQQASTPLLSGGGTTSLIIDLMES